MGHRHDEVELLAAAVDAALDGGLSELTFGRLAKRIGIADRTLVYYFESKHVLLERVLVELGARLIGELESAFGSERRDPVDLLRAAAPLLIGPEPDRVFAVWFELAGHAAAGHEPQRTLAKTMIDGWIGWLADRIDLRTAPQRRRAAVALLAQLDGVLLLHHLGHTDAARDALAALTR